MSNSIYSNGRLAIELGDDGITLPNDPLDGDEGANNRQNYPEFTSITDDGTTVTGTLNSTPNTEFTIEIFYTPAAVIIVDGKEQNTKYDSDNPTTTLVSKKGGKWVSSGSKIVVKNSLNTLSGEYTYP